MHTDQTCQHTGRTSGQWTVHQKQKSHLPHLPAQHTSNTLPRRIEIDTTEWNEIKQYHEYLTVASSQHHHTLRCPAHLPIRPGMSTTTQQLENRSWHWSLQEHLQASGTASHHTIREWSKNRSCTPSIITNTMHQNRSLFFRLWMNTRSM